MKRCQSADFPEPITSGEENVLSFALELEDARAAARLTLVIPTWLLSPLGSATLISDTPGRRPRGGGSIR
jgi:hypothetical protein